MDCKQTRENLVLHRQDSMLQGENRRDFLRHLRGCKSCQVEYEGLLQTASLLGSLETPVPPRELLGNIQNKIRETHKRRRIAFFAAPFTWLYDKLKLDFSPKIVNCTALFCYLIATTFLLKLVFFTDTSKQADVPEQNFGYTAMEVSRIPYVKIAPSQLASLKHRGVDPEKTNRENKAIFTPTNVDSESSEVWYNHTINEETEDVEEHFTLTDNKKLALFWNEIKTNL